VVLGAAVFVAFRTLSAAPEAPSREVAAADVVATAPSRPVVAAPEHAGERRGATRARDAANDSSSASGVAAGDEDAAAPPPAATGAVSLSVEVVDDAGDRLHDGVVRFRIAPDEITASQQAASARCAGRFEDARLGAANPFVLGELPPGLDGI